ncbi:PREDICTED: sensory neuron membrane protein 2-like isoform X2 [Habropoda laboriosa]|uniref:sensory neuron membrane protein 2-like isoform X2 n=1 Tax=Habropoda laboriosa TaxID=597456 RepID=UPI00083D4318|nr:PREDICTED: sensory neuron membrane protein 2-like isoform X2 [Habropoda laboriosa]
MFCYHICGAVCIVIGIFIVSRQFMWTEVRKNILTKLPLIEGTETYKVWLSPTLLTFGCYLFNVTNPDGVMRGEKPHLAECGPFMYDEIYGRYVLDVDKETDEIKYVTKSLYSFNKESSMTVSRQDKVTILNPAYVGTIALVTTLPPDILAKYGNHIPKLFPNRSSIFLTARPTDILFDGLKVTCNLKKYPELDKVCKTLKINVPPVLRTTDREDVYLLSLFQRMNDTYRGPFSMNRGLKNITRLGDTTSYKGKRVQTVWNSDKCNTVRGSDTITWPPLIEPLPFVSTFIPDLCRSIEADYEGDAWVHGLLGSRFVMKERMWDLNETECYCLPLNHVPQCLPQGLLDVSECQKVPIIFSEPHFLHADPELLTYARGLRPNKRIHETYIIIEPNTGTPLSGSKKMQLNLKLTKQRVDLLSNVSEGYFPMLWCENGNTPTLAVISFTYQILRMANIIWFMEKVPLIVGIYILLMSTLFCDCTKRKVKPTISPAESILISSYSRSDSDAHIAPRRHAHAFQ